MPRGTLAVTGDIEADRLLNADPLALLIGMLLDQQIPMEWAFMGPQRLQDRLGRPLCAKDLAARTPEEIEALFREKPALHRFPSSMARRTHELCQFITERYAGDAGAIWRGVRDGETLYERLRELPGYGDEKARIFVAILAKRFAKRPRGWETAAGPFADDEPRSVADIDGPEALERVRAWKKAKKAAGKSKQD